MVQRFLVKIVFPLLLVFQGIYIKPSLLFLHWQQTSEENPILFDKDTKIILATVGQAFKHYDNGIQFRSWQRDLAQCSSSCVLVDAGPLADNESAVALASGADAWIIEGNDYVNDYKNGGILYGKSKRTAGQHLALLAIEPHMDPIYRDPLWRLSFDTLISYHASADIRKVYSCHLHAQLYTQGPKPDFHTKNKSVVAFVSNCIEPRNSLLGELVGNFPVDSYGKCWHNTDLQGDSRYAKSWQRMKMETMQNYMFGFAFENAVLPEYVSEKIMNAFLTGTIPIYSGAPEVGFFAPSPNSFIDLKDFSSVAELAEHLNKVATEESLYNSYFEWNLDAYKARVLDGLCAAESFICKICDRVKAGKIQKVSM